MKLGSGICWCFRCSSEERPTSSLGKLNFGESKVSSVGGRNSPSYQVTNSLDTVVLGDMDTEIILTGITGLLP